MSRKGAVRYAISRVRSNVAGHLPTRQNVFAYAVWQDAMIVHLDLSAMQCFDAVDHSCLSWLEARYHWSRVDLALQWQLNGGAPAAPCTTRCCSGRFGKRW